MKLDRGNRKNATGSSIKAKRRATNDELSQTIRRRITQKSTEKHKTGRERHLLHKKRQLCAH